MKPLSQSRKVRVIAPTLAVLKLFALAPSFADDAVLYLSLSVFTPLPSQGRWIPR